MEPPSTITGVSCVSTTFCVATTAQRMQSDVIHVFDGSGWQTVPSLDTYSYPSRCPAPPPLLRHGRRR